MAKPIVPTRPSNFITKLNQGEQNALSYYVLFGASRIDAVVTFARPDLAGSRGKPVVDEYVKQFFARKEVKEYLDAYSTTLNEFLHPNKKEDEKPKGTLEERKAATKAKLVEFAMQLADNIDNAEDKEAVLKIADKVGLLDGDEEVVELPRRYLPVSCSECEYRKFIEENCERIEDGMDIASEE